MFPGCTVSKRIDHPLFSRFSSYPISRIQTKSSSLSATISQPFSTISTSSTPDQTLPNSTFTHTFPALLNALHRLRIPFQFASLVPLPVRLSLFAQNVVRLPQNRLPFSSHWRRCGGKREIQRTGGYRCGTVSSTGVRTGIEGMNQAGFLNSIVFDLTSTSYHPSLFRSYHLSHSLSLYPSTFCQS